MGMFKRPANHNNAPTPTMMRPRRINQRATVFKSGIGNWFTSLGGGLGLGVEVPHRDVCRPGKWQPGPGEYGR